MKPSDFRRPAVLPTPTADLVDAVESRLGHAVAPASPAHTSQKKETVMTTPATTFADLIKRHGSEIAFLAAVHDENSAPAELTTLTDADFVGLVGSAKENLELFRMEDWGDGLDSALTYLNDALEADDPTAEAFLLGKAGGHMANAYEAASELACNLGIDFKR